MEGNNPNPDANQSNDSYNQQAPYDPYAYPYYQGTEYYYPPAPPIPQGDPSSALSSMVYQLQQHTQQRQALGAMAAASISSALGSRPPPADYYAQYYGTPEQRSVIQYDDLSMGPPAANNVAVSKPEAQQQPEDPNAPSVKK